jgi:hypothetical protein
LIYRLNFVQELTIGKKMIHAHKSDILTPPSYFDRYISLVEDIPLETAFEKSILEIEQLDLAALLRVGDQTYAPGKWTVRQIVQHLTDWERIMAYRALVFARKATDNPLPGHDQDRMTENLYLDNRSLDQVLGELKSVRQATFTLFDGLDATALSNTGRTWDYELSALAWGFTILGHQKHHFAIIRERYLTIVQ